jgi:hypothetical protein
LHLLTILTVSIVRHMISGRPLLDTKPDSALFVDRGRELDQLEAAVDARLNALVLGDRGAGKTSTLRQLAFRLRERGVGVEFVDGSVAPDAASILQLVRFRLAGPRSTPAPLLPEHMLPGVVLGEPEILLRVVDDLASALEEGDHSAVILDGAPSGKAAHTLFGRLRDELWQLPLTWLVSADADEIAEYLRPPADAFFEEVIRLPRLPRDQALELLERRLSPDEVARVVTDDLLEFADGNPRRLLAAAREVLRTSDAPDETARRRAALQRKVEALGRPYSMVVAELEANGAASASDESLLRRLGWTRPRAAQVLKRLEEEGIVTSSTRAGGGGGRPRKVYEVVGPVYR